MPPLSTLKFVNNAIRLNIYKLVQGAKFMTLIHTLTLTRYMYYTVSLYNVDDISLLKLDSSTTFDCNKIHYIRNMYKITEQKYIHRTAKTL